MQIQSMEFKNVQFKETAVDSSSRTFEGYAATWDLDETGDIINQGAFKKSIAERLPRKDIKVLWQHLDPIGVPVEMHEDDNGLYVKGKISRTSLGDDALELLRDGAVNRLSIGFTIPKGKTMFDEDGHRIINEVRLYEFSPVTFPANEMAVITSVKSLQQQAIIAKSKGFKFNDSAEIKELFTELKTLLQDDEPVKATQRQLEPLTQDVKGILSNFNKDLRGLYHGR